MRVVCLAFSALAACSEHVTSLPPTEGDLVPQASISQRELIATFGFDGVGWRSPVVAAPSGATRAGVLARLSESASRPLWHARGFDGDGDPGAWVEMDVTWSEGPLVVARAELSMDAFAFQVRVSDRAAIAAMTYSAVVPEVQPEQRGAVGVRRDALRPELAGLVRTRAEWSARATGCSQSDPVKTKIAIHHTVTEAMGDPATNVRAVQAFHMDTRGYCDVGYHFLVTLDGQIWEGRPLELQGAHVLAENPGNIGVSHVGCFHTSECDAYPPQVPPEAMIDASASIVGRLAELYGIGISATSVKGHRDHAGAATACPGDHLHARLGDIRQRAGDDPVMGPALRAVYVSQGFPLASQPFVLPPGAEQSGYLELRNEGTTTWEPGRTLLATTEPRDIASPIAAGSWLAPNRPATIDRVVVPGETGRFTFWVRAPGSSGVYPQFFGLVHDGTWFSDPGQGGPPDDQLQVRLSVETGAPLPDAGPPPPPPPFDAGVDAGGTGLDAALASDATAALDSAEAPDSGAMRPPPRGCGCRVAGESGAAPGLPLLLIATLVRWRRRR